MLSRWAKQRAADHLAAKTRLQEAWNRIFDELPLEAIPDPSEQAEADAIWAEIEAVTEHDRWPRHLYWTL